MGLLFLHAHLLHQWGLHAVELSKPANETCIVGLPQNVLFSLLPSTHAVYMSILHAPVAAIVGVSVAFIAVSGGSLQAVGHGLQSTLFTAISNISYRFKVILSGVFGCWDKRRATGRGGAASASHAVTAYPSGRRVCGWQRFGTFEICYKQLVS
jgi:hypothetical protein